MATFQLARDGLRNVGCGNIAVGRSRPAYTCGVGFMTLSDFASLAGIVSGLAVLVSLLYLNLQIRHTHRNQRSLINQGVAARDHNIMLMVQAPHMADIYAKATSKETDFTRTEILLMVFLVRAIIGQMQDVHIQRRAGLIEQDTYDYIDAGVRSVFGIPLARAVWPLVRPSVSPEAIALGDAFLANAPVGDSLEDLPALIKASLIDIQNGKPA